MWRIFISQEFLQEKLLTTRNLQWNFEQRVATQLPLAGKSQPEFAQPSEVNDRDWELFTEGVKVSFLYELLQHEWDHWEREEEKEREIEKERWEHMEDERREGRKWMV